MMIRTTHLGALAAAAGALVAVGLLVLMLVVEVRPAEATFPGQNGRIAYSGFEGPGGPGDPIPTWGDREIYTINPDGGDRVQVTDNHAANAYQADDVRPSYSPDGETIAYAGHDGLDYEIYTINAGGKRMVKVTDNLVNDYEPAYSPDGQQIAYVGLDVPGTGDYDIFTINVDGGGRFNVTDNTTLFDSDPAYSPDGRQKAVETRLAYSASDGNDDEIYTINVGGGRWPNSPTTRRRTPIPTTRLMARR
jgi:Tol biopolymer transport system component